MMANGNTAVGNPETDETAIREIFGHISAIPRCSGNEDGVAQLLRERAVGAGCTAEEDAAGNLYLSLPGAGGGEDAPFLVLQGHMDMVCVAAPGSDHDFAREGIEWYEEDGFLRARGTTLGADNGIGLAIGLRLLEEPGPVHPPLQLIATREEETSMHGAAALDATKVAGTTIINIDEEEDGVITTSSAGMMAMTFTFPTERVRVRGDGSWQIVEVAGGRGGHSGIEAGSGRANAISLLGHLLTRLMAETGCAVSTLTGGERDNVIPGQARACVGFDPAVVKQAVRCIREEERVCRDRYRESDPDLRIRIFPATPQETILSPETATSAVSLMGALPSGVCAWDTLVPDLVATSANPARVRVTDEALTVHLSARSNNDEALAALGETLRQQGKEAGAAVVIPGVSPAWPARAISPVRDMVSAAYHDLFGGEMQIRGIHAGLETAWIAQKMPDADLIALGPDIRDAHTTRESASLPSAGRVCFLLRETFRRCVAD